MKAKPKGARKSALPPPPPAPGGAKGGADPPPWIHKEIHCRNKQVLEKEKRPQPKPFLKAGKTTVPPTPLRPPSKVPLYIGGLALYSFAVYGAYVWITTSKSIPKEPIHAKALGEQEDISHVYDSIAKRYDKDIGASEFFMGLPLLRRSMAKRAWGDVLEASAGTGRNIKYYPLSGNVRKVKSLTFVDSSGPMLQVARKAFHKRYHGFKDIHFVVGDAGAPIRTPSGGKFDTVLQSMGVCSHHSPIQLLHNLGEACKDDGNIILLEHGKSHYDWLNRILDRFADKHAEKWGCWWNRDVEGILNESGLRVVKLKRYHFGTTYWIEAKPPRR